MKTGVLLIGILFSLNGFAQPSAAKGSSGGTKPAAAEKKAPAAAPVKLSSMSDSMQYVLGAYIGQYIINTGFAINKAELFNKGMDDLLLGKPLLVRGDSIPRLMESYLKLSAKERGIRQEKQLFENIKKQSGLGLLPSGVCYAIVKAGTGKRPMPADSVELHLKGFLADGKQFEDTYPKNIPYKTTPAGVIPGMSEILQMMPTGSLWRVYIPSASGFAEKGLPGVIPPYSALIYEVELLKVTDGGGKK